MTNRSTTPVLGRCEVYRCRADSVGLLVFDNGWQRFEHPLCGEHSDPKFHLRNVDAPNWKWCPHEEAADAR